MTSSMSERVTPSSLCVVKGDRESRPRTSPSAERNTHTWSTPTSADTPRVVLSSGLRAQYWRVTSWSEKGNCIREDCTSFVVTLLKTGSCWNRNKQLDDGYGKNNFSFWIRAETLMKTVRNRISGLLNRRKISCFRTVVRMHRQSVPLNSMFVPCSGKIYATGIILKFNDVVTNE